MTIRRNVDIRWANDQFTDFLDGLDAKPGEFPMAEQVRDQVLGYPCDEFLRKAKAAGLTTCNCDGIREIEALMFDMLIRMNPDGELAEAMAVGRNMRFIDEDDGAERAAQMAAGL